MPSKDCVIYGSKAAFGTLLLNILFICTNVVSQTISSNCTSYSYDDCIQSLNCGFCNTTNECINVDNCQLFSSNCTELVPSQLKSCNNSQYLIMNACITSIMMILFGIYAAIILRSKNSVTPERKHTYYIIATIAVFYIGIGLVLLSIGIYEWILYIQTGSIETYDKAIFLLSILNILTICIAILGTLCIGFVLLLILIFGCTLGIGLVCFENIYQAISNYYTNHNCCCTRELWFRMKVYIIWIGQRTRRCCSNSNSLLVIDSLI